MRVWKVWNTCSFRKWKTRAFRRFLKTCTLEWQCKFQKPYSLTRPNITLLEHWSVFLTEKNHFYLPHEQVSTNSISERVSKNDSHSNRTNQSIGWNYVLVELSNIHTTSTTDTSGYKSSCPRGHQNTFQVRRQHCARSFNVISKKSKTSICEDEEWGDGNGV